MIKQTSDYSNFGAKNEDDFQAILSVVGQVIERLPSRSTKAALVKAYDGLRWFLFVFLASAFVFLASVAFHIVNFLRI